MGLVGILALTYLGPVIATVARAISASDLQALTSFTTPLIGPVSVVLAFYFRQAAK
jgi:hypothetical protein